MKNASEYSWQVIVSIAMQTSLSSICNSTRRDKDSNHSLQKVTHRLTLPSRNPTPRYRSKMTENRYLNKYLYSNVHSNIIHNSQRWKQPKCLSAHEWINRIWCIHPIKLYSAIGRSEVLIRATTWMELVNSMLSERRQTQKVTYCKISRISKSLET